jgi:hypothetical protein
MKKFIFTALIAFTLAACSDDVVTDDNDYGTDSVADHESLDMPVEDEVDVCESLCSNVVVCDNKEMDRCLEDCEFMRGQYEGTECLGYIDDWYLCMAELSCDDFDGVFNPDVSDKACLDELENLGNCE